MTHTQNPNRPETPEYGKMVRRVIRTYGERVADADPEDLADMIELRAILEASIATAIHGQRENHGRSWADIGRGLGTTRQAAQMRYGGTAPKVVRFTSGQMDGSAGHF